MNPPVRRIAPLFLLSLWLTLTAVAQEPEIKFHFINVGQANSTLIEAQCGAVLIDAGSQDDAHADKLIAYLDAFFERRADLNHTLKLVGITHNHVDHTSALRRIVEKYTVERYIDNGQLQGRGTENPNWVRKEVAENGRAITIKEIENDAMTTQSGGRGLTDDVIGPLKCEKCDPGVRVLSGRRSNDENWAHEEFENKNNHSIVWRIDFGETSLLITGDLEEAGIEELVETYSASKALDADIYHVGHHGSDNATTTELLEAVTPERAVISMGSWLFGRGSRNRFTTYRYGHPRLSVVQLLQDNVTVRRTTSKLVKVGRRSRSFTDFRVRKSIFGTGWDGTVVMTGKLGGQVRTNTEN